MKEIPGTRTEIVGKACRLFKRSNSSLWWVSIKLPKKPRIFRSTGTTDPALAHPMALDLYQSYQRRLASHGDLAIEKTATISNLWEVFREDDPTSKSHGTWRRDAIADHMALKWLPYLGKRTIVSATPDFERRIAGYVEWRRGKPSRYRKKPYAPKSGRKPKAGKSTLLLEIQSLRQVMRHGYKRGLIDRVPEIDMKSLNLEWTKRDTLVTRRAHFTKAEMLQLPELLDEFINQEKVGYRSNHKWARRRLKAVVLLMGSTGMRPAEMRNLRVRDLVIESDDEGKECLIVKIGRSKGGTKTVPHSTAAQWFGNRDLPVRWIQEWLDSGIVSLNKTAFVFASRDGRVPRMTISHHFNEFLKHAKLKTDREFGKKGRSLYSLRHGVVTDLLNRDIPIHMISKALGTSPTILMQSYDHTSVAQMKDAFFD